MRKGKGWLVVGEKRHGMRRKCEIDEKRHGVRRRCEIGEKRHCLL